MRRFAPGRHDPSMRPFLIAACLSTLLSGLLQTPSAVAGTDAPSQDPTASGVWPLDPDPPVLRGFDLPDARWEAGHRGVDLLGRPAQAVRAPIDGTVSYVGRIAGRGVVTLSHGGTRTTYQPVVTHLSVGNDVAAGETLGWLHPAGSHCAPQSCLHWGWRRGTEYLDPMGLVGREKIRLLPLWSLGHHGVRHPWEEFRPAGAPARTPS